MSIDQSDKLKTGWYESNVPKPQYDFPWNQRDLYKPTIDPSSNMPEELKKYQDALDSMRTNVKPKEHDADEQYMIELNKHLKKCDSTVSLVGVLLERPFALNLTMVLDNLPLAQAALHEGLIERRCDKSTHYYVVTDTGYNVRNLERL